MRACFIALLVVVFSAAGAGAVEPLRVSSFSTILTEIAEQVGGEAVVVTGHVRAGVDPHEFVPTPADFRAAAAADVVLLSAKHIESYLAKLKRATGTRALVVEVGAHFSSLRMPDENDPSRLMEDPHWWHSVGHMQRATLVVRDAFTERQPALRRHFAARAEDYRQRLAALHRWVKLQVSQVPRDRRRLVTSHDAFQYFAREFGFEIYAIEGVSPIEEPSSQRVSSLIAQIRALGVKALFSESLRNPKVLREITRETGAKLAGSLYADGLGEGRAATYEGMMRHNVGTIVEALR